MLCESATDLPEPTGNIKSISLKIGYRKYLEIDFLIGGRQRHLAFSIQWSAYNIWHQKRKAEPIKDPASHCLA